MLPRLQAEERICTINDAACGSGNLTPETARQHLRQLERATGEREAARSGDANPAQLAVAGIGLRVPSETAEAHLNKSDSEGHSHE